ncbi:MAG: transcription antitermination factor NusB [Candidatus Omnitrophica bacterium]|nr:transcription antitermination factor NusB [Candidatus Omnitrophota bacterium]
MRKRSRAREIALQVLYQIDITGDRSEDVLNNFWQMQAKPVDADIQEFAISLVEGVSKNLEVINKTIARHAANWQIERMAVVDRNILRVGCYELLFREDIPIKVSINEAVELAKRYSGTEAAKFVNGILDKIKLEKDK